MSRFLECYKIVFGNEVGLSDHKADRGGRTKDGVTQKTYDLYRARIKKPFQDVALITEDEHKDIFRQYWRDARCDFLPPPLDLQVFDAAVNHGASRAIKLLQRVLGVTEDGVFGPVTLDALREDVLSFGVHDLINRYLDERARFYERIVERDPSQKVFAKGWANRIERMRVFV